MSCLDTDTCQVRWCQEPPSHGGVHRRYLGEVMLSRRQDVTSVNLTLESRDAEGQPRVVLTIPTDTTARYSSAVLTHAQAETLRELLTDGIERSKGRHETRKEHV